MTDNRDDERVTVVETRRGGGGALAVVVVILLALLLLFLFRDQIFGGETTVEVPSEVDVDVSSGGAE